MAWRQPPHAPQLPASKEVVSLPRPEAAATGT
jgi:hypothetical protein